MKESRFSPIAETALRLAQSAAGELGHSYVGTEHLLLGLIREEEGMAHRMLIGAGVTEEALCGAIRRSGGGALPGLDPVQGLTPRARRVVELAVEDAQRWGERFVSTEHLLSGILREGNNMAVRTLRTVGADPRQLLTLLQQKEGRSPARERPLAREEAGSKTLRECSRDLTAEARGGRLDPVIGRDAEIRHMIRILCRRTKNNPCLLGEPGVGKTALAEGLARSIVAGEVPEELLDQRVLSLDIAGMVAGTKYRGEFEERIRKVLDEVKRAGNIILFLDELHTVVGAGSAEGAVDAANILKPALSRGELRLIGATTVGEYRRYIEKDAALERRFQPIMLQEPSAQMTLSILKGLRQRYETHHGLTITDEALAAAVSLSTRYLPGRFLPDKAIDLMDEAAALVHMESLGGDPKVGAEDIALVVSAWTGIPVTRLREEEGEKLRRMEEALSCRVVGQREAVEALSRAIRRSRSGLRAPERPIGSFLFLGPTGVGKTELCKALAEVLFGEESALLRFDMSEYMERHSVSRLLGSPPGYVGHEEGGQLTEKVRRRPYSVVLFDEMEKAHEDVWNVLLQILDEGRVTDAQGRQVDFRNTVIVMTGNVGAKRLAASGTRLGFLPFEQKRSGDDALWEELRATFRPEFLNRVDEILFFHPLGEEELRQVARRMLGALSERMKTLGLTLEAGEEAVAALAKAGFDPKNGARPLGRLIRTRVEDPLAEALLAGELRKGDTALVTVEEEQVVVRSQQPILT